VLATAQEGVQGQLMAGGVVLLSFLTGLGAGIVGLIVVVISVMVVGLALRSPQ